MTMPAYLRALRAQIGHTRIQLPSVSILTRDEEGRTLLIRHVDSGLWVLPGGIVEPLESPADAAVREMFEEVGLIVEPTRIIGVYNGEKCQITYANGDMVAYTLILFDCRVVGGALKADLSEVLELGYFDRAQMDALAQPPWMDYVRRDGYGDNLDAKFDPPSKERSTPS